LKKIIGGGVLIFLIVTAIVVIVFNKQLPSNAPLLIISNNNSEIKTVKTTYSWVDNDIGGNSNISANPDEDLKDINPVNVKPNSKITFKFDSKIDPKWIEVIEWKNKEIATKKKYDVSENFFLSPQDKGVYVYEIVGTWDDSHNSAHAFKIAVN